MDVNINEIVAVQMIYNKEKLFDISELNHAINNAKSISEIWKDIVRTYKAGILEKSGVLW